MLLFHWGAILAIRAISKAKVSGAHDNPMKL